MKLITAIIKPSKLDEVREALSEIGVQGITVTEVKGFGRQKVTELYRGAEYVVDFYQRPRSKLLSKTGIVEVALSKRLKTSARTGKIGDGKIFVYSLDQVIRIRTGETGNRSPLSVTEREMKMKSF